MLANTDPLFVAVLAAVFLGEVLSGRQWSGLLVGLVGATVVVWDGPLWPPALSPGALVVVGGALAWSVGTVVAARGVRGRAEPLALAGWQMTLGGVVLAVAGVIGEGPPDATGAREVALIVLLAAVGSALPLALFYLALIQRPRRGGVRLVLPGAGGGGADGVAAAGRDADRPAAGGDGGGVRRPLVRARPEGFGAGPVGRLADTAVSPPASARRP